MERVPTRLPRANVPVRVGEAVVAVHIPEASIAGVVQVAHAVPKETFARASQIPKFNSC